MSNESEISNSSVSQVTAPVVMYSGRLVGPFEPNAGIPWVYYEDMVKTQLDFRGVTDDDKRKLAFLSEIGPKCYVEVRNSLNGVDPASLTLESLLTALRKRYSPKKLVIAQRDRMLVTKQKEGQALTDYYSELQEVANHCELNKITDAAQARDMLMVQVFLRGIQKESTRVKLLQEENLTAEKALELAQMYEQAVEEGHGMGTHKESAGIARVSAGRQCYCCGKTGHMKAQCPKRDARCNLCGRVGHLEKMCQKRQGDAKVKYVQEDERVEDYVSMFLVNDDKKSAVYVTVEVCGKPVKLMIDSGSAVTMITEKTWLSIGKPKLTKPDCELRGVTGQKLRLVGKVVVPVQYGGARGKGCMYVYQGSTNLLGRNAIRALGVDLNKLFHDGVNSVEAIAANKVNSVSAGVTHPVYVPVVHNHSTSKELGRIDEEALNELLMSGLYTLIPRVVEALEQTMVIAIENSRSKVLTASQAANVTKGAGKKKSRKRKPKKLKEEGGQLDLTPINPSGDGGRVRVELTPCLGEGIGETGKDSHEGSVNCQLRSDGPHTGDAVSSCGSDTDMEADYWKLHESLQDVLREQQASGSGSSTSKYGGSTCDDDNRYEQDAMFCVNIESSSQNRGRRKDRKNRARKNAIARVKS